MEIDRGIREKHFKQVYTEDIVREIKEEFSRGVELHELSKKYDVPKSTIHYWIHGHRPPNKVDPVTKNLILEEVRSGHDKNLIAQKYNVTTRVINMWLCNDKLQTPKLENSHNHETIRELKDRIQLLEAIIKKLL